MNTLVTPCRLMLLGVTWNGKCLEANSKARQGTEVTEARSNDALLL